MFCNVEIEINSDCNRKCWYCPNHNHVRKERGEMSEQVFMEIMYQLQQQEYSDRITYHFYGEPLLCSKLDRYVQITREMLPNAYPILFSNGDFLTQTRLEDLLQSGIKYFIVTQHIGWKNEFSNLYQMLPNFLKDKIFFRTYDEISFNNRGGMIDMGNNGQEVFSTPCALPSTMIQITLEGNVLPCCNDYEQLNSMGNICDELLCDIWNSKKYTLFREELLQGRRDCYLPCKNCNLIG